VLLVIQVLLTFSNKKLMGNNRRTLMFLPIVLAVGLFTAQKVLAVCPLCTVAVGAGVGLSRWLGIDDVITGLWIGGLIVSLIAWSENWLDKKIFTSEKERF